MPAPHPPHRPAPRPCRAGLLLAACLALGTQAARADQFVRSPQVNLGEYELEMNGETGTAGRRDPDQFQSYTYALAVSPLRFLRLELEAETAALPGQNLSLSARTLESYWQLTEPGEYWLAAGMFAEYSQGQGGGATNTLTFGPMLQKDTAGPWGHRLVHTLNLFVERDLGPNSTARTGLDFAWQTRLLSGRYLQPGVEIYGSSSDLGQAGGFAAQSWQAGPVLAGAVHPFAVGKFSYELGYQFGLSNAAPRGALRWKLEYEIAF